MIRRSGSRQGVAAVIQRVETTSESPADLRARHRRFLENSRKLKGRDDTPSQPQATDGESDSNLDPDSEDDSPSEDESKPGKGQPSPIPPNVADTPGTSITGGSPTNTLPLQPPPSPTTSEAPKSTLPSPPSTTGRVRQSVISDSTRTLTINTPISHSNQPTTKVPPKATTSPPTTSTSSIPSSATSLATPSSPEAKDISSSLSTKLSTTITTSAIPSQSTSSKISSSSKFGSAATPGLVAQPDTLSTSSSPAPVPTGVGINSSKGIMAGSKESNTKTAGIVVGVLFGAFALLVIGWIVFRKKKTVEKSNQRHINWDSEKEPAYAGNRPGSSIMGGGLYAPATTAGPNSTAGPPSVAGWPAYDGSHAQAGAGYPSYDLPSAVPTALFSAGTQKPGPLPEYKPPGGHQTRGLAEAPVPNSLEAHPGVLVMGPSPVAAQSKWPAWRDSVATVSSLASVPRFRTIKSWVGDQRNRVERQPEVPDVPSVPAGTYSRLE